MTCHLYGQENVPFLNKMHKFILIYLIYTDEIFTVLGVF